MPDAQLKRAAASYFDGELLGDGWQTLPRHRHLYLRNVSSEVAGRIGVGFAFRRFDQTYVIDLFVGVRHLEVGNLVDTFYRNAKSAAAATPTVSQNLADVTKVNISKDLVFANEQDLRSACEAAARTLREDGYPFMESLSDLRSIRTRFEEYPIGASELDSLAVIYGLLGEEELAKTSLRRRVAESKDESAPEYAAQARGFIERFEEHFGFSIR